MKIVIVVFCAILFSLPSNASDTLYNELGEKQGIQTIVKRTADLAFTDKRTAEQFKRTKKERLVLAITDQICALSGGPCRYRGLNMKKAHFKLQITVFEFNAFVESLQQAMRESGVGYRTQNKLIALLAPMKRDIVEK